MKKFWNKASATADIFIYGDITSEAWGDTDTTAKSFVDDLNSFGGKPVTVHLNSGGGDVFAALAIHNAIKNYSGGVTVAIDGLAASAASLIAMGGKRITMANNALMMIHEPAVWLLGYYDAAELSKAQTQLTAVRDVIIETYESRIKASDVPAQSRLNIPESIQSETWLNASQALAGGLIDEITGDVELKIDDAQKLLFVNSLAIDIKKFDAAKMRRAMEETTMDIKDEQGFFDKLKTAITDAITLKNTSAPEPAPTIDAAQIRQQELSRIRDLQSLKCENAAVNALVDMAVNRGDSVDEIQPYIDAVKSVPVSTAQDTADKIVAVIRDQMTSGAEGVQGGQPEMTADDLQKMRAKAIADFANAQI